MMFSPGLFDVYAQSTLPCCSSSFYWLLFVPIENVCIDEHLLIQSTGEL